MSNIPEVIILDTKPRYVLDSFECVDKIHAYPEERTARIAAVVSPTRYEGGHYLLVRDNKFGEWVWIESYLDEATLVHEFGDMRDKMLMP